MADADQTPDVLTSLPKTRPQRRSSKRDAAPKAKAAPRQPAAAKRAPAKPKAAPKPRPAAKPKLPPAGFEAPRSDERGTPSGAELVGTAIQAAGELAQIGAAIGKQALKSALRIGR
jgi:hypothetical protein